MQSSLVTSASQSAQPTEIRPGSYYHRGVGLFYVLSWNIDEEYVIVEDCYTNKPKSFNIYDWIKQVKEVVQVNA